MAGNHSRLKGGRGEREVKKIFIDNGYKAVKTGSGICPDFPGDVEVYLDDNRILLCEVKWYGQGFVKQYKELNKKDNVIIASYNTVGQVVYVMKLESLFAIINKGIEYNYKLVSRDKILVKLDNNLEKLTLEYSQKVVRENLRMHPVVVKRTDRRPWLASLYASDFEVLRYCQI